MAKCPNHATPQVSCHVCFSDEDLMQQIEFLQSVKVPQSKGQGEKSKPRRTDMTKVRKSSWKDEFDI